MGTPVGFAVVLIGHEIGLRVLPDQPIDLLDGPVGSQMTRGQKDFGPPGTQNLPTLLAGRFGHGQQKPVPFDRADHGQPDPRVAAGRLDDRPVTGQFPGALTGLDHVEGGPVLDRPPGVEILQLGQNPDSGIGAQVSDFHQGRIADGVYDRTACSGWIARSCHGRGMVALGGTGGSGGRAPVLDSSAVNTAATASRTWASLPEASITR